MSTPFSLQSAVRRSLALAAVAAVTWTGASAQTGGAAQTAASNPAVAPAVNFAFPVVNPSASLPGSAASDSNSSVSSSAATQGTASTEDAGSAATQLNLASLEKGISLPGVNAQYGRRRYGAPRYRGGNTNADGSEKYEAYAGVGLTLPVGTNSNYLTTSYGLQVGGGRNFNKHFALNVEFDYDHFGLTGAAISQQAYLYDPVSNSYAGYLDANSHIWNFSVQPTYQIYSGEGLGAYVTGGAGFYHKVTNFTLPSEEEDLYGDVFEENVNVDHYTSNAPGFDCGLGLTYKFSHFSNEKFYAEVRYVYIENSARAGDTVATALTYTGNNYFPQNSNKTTYIPIKFGIRF